MQHLPVLDGHVRLVDHMGSDLSVVRAARVSYDAEWRAGQDEGSDARLIRYLLKHRHTSPFEHVTFTLDVKAPLFVIRQWQRHRTWSYNEVSARYSALPEEVFIPEAATIGSQALSNKQGRDLVEENLADRQSEVDEYARHVSEGYALYERLLDRKWPRELARGVLPVAIYSHMFATVNLHNLMRFLELRLDKHAQMEIRQYARAVYQLVRPVVPVSMDLWRELNPELCWEE